jgi:hypothetical protein
VPANCELDRAYQFMVFLHIISSSKFMNQFAETYIPNNKEMILKIKNMKKKIKNFKKRRKKRRYKI